DAQLKIVDQHQESFSDLVVDLSLPENQFLKMFKQKNQLHILTETLGEVHYEVCVPSGQGVGLLEEFLDLSEAIPFFGDKYLITTNRIKWKSLVLLYYLLDYNINSTEDGDHIYLTYSAIPLRKVSNYINWRFTQCQATPSAIQWSLLNSHSDVYLNNGMTGRIKKVEWESDKKMPSKLIFQLNDTNGSEISKLPSQLYQGCHHFVIGQNQQHKARMALEEISYRHTQALVQFSKTKSVKGSFRKLEKTTQQYERYIGSTVWPRYEQLRAIGELQNRQLTEEHLDLVNNQRHKTDSRKLLVISCSATKVEKPEKILALLRYSGFAYIFIKSILLHDKWPSSVDILIISAKYGLLHPQEPIPYYNQRLTSQTMENLQKLVDTKLKSLNLSSYSECFINLSKMYFQSINTLYSILSEQGCKTISCENHGLTKRNYLMLDWLAYRF
ncbi:MAG: hypothetical protein ACXADY_10510, partial [Candidatus Hodarchaeales archaeon]